MKPSNSNQSVSPTKKETSTPSSVVTTLQRFKNGLLLSLGGLLATSGVALAQTAVRPIIEVGAGSQTQMSPRIPTNTNLLLQLNIALPIGGNRCPRSDALCRRPTLSQYVIARVRARAAVDHTGTDLESMVRQANIEFIPIAYAPSPQTHDRSNDGFGRFGVDFGFHVQFVPMQLMRDPVFMTRVRAAAEAIGIEGAYQSFPSMSAGFFLDFAARALGYRYQELMNSADPSTTLNQHGLEIGGGRIMTGLIIAPSSAFTIQIGVGAEGDLSVSMDDAHSVTADLRATARARFTFSRWLGITAQFTSNHRLTTSVADEYAGAQSQEVTLSALFNWD
jgi:hypothetical protein